MGEGAVRSRSCLRGGLGAGALRLRMESGDRAVGKLLQGDRPVDVRLTAETLPELGESCKILQRLIRRKGISK